MTMILTLEKMKAYKEEYGLSCRLISEKSGVPESTVNKVFGGITKPRQSTLEALSRAFFEYSVSNNIEDYGTTTYEELLKKYGQTDMIAEEHPFNAGIFGGKNPLYEGTSAIKYGDKENGDYTIDDYDALPEKVRAELIEGFMFEMNAPSYIHQTILLEMAVQIQNGIRKRKGGCKVYVAPADVELGDKKNTIVQPDIFILCNKNMKDSIKRLHAAPDFVVEILSESTRKKDIFMKTDIYMEYGVREYWIVDPEEKRITVYYFEKREYRNDYSFDDIVPISIYDGKISVDFNVIKHELEETFL